MAYEGASKEERDSVIARWKELDYSKKVGVKAAWAAKEESV